MKRNIVWVMSGPLICLLAGCATATVSANYERSTDFSKYRTFMLGEEQKETGDPRFDDPELRKALQDAVRLELSAKGLTPVIAGPADLAVKYYITVEAKKEPLGDYQMRMPPIYDPGAGVTSVNTYAMRENMDFHYEEGTLVVDLIDPLDQKIVWRGTMEGMVDPAASQAKRLSRVPGALAKLLAKYPPK